MVETVINLRPTEHWTKRELRYHDAEAIAIRTAHALHQEGVLAPKLARSEVEQLASDATMGMLERFDAQMRSLVMSEQRTFEHQLAPELSAFAIRQILELIRENGSLTIDSDAHFQTLSSVIASEFPTASAKKLLEYSDLSTANELMKHVREQLIAKSMLSPESDPFSLRNGFLNQSLQAFSELLGMEQTGFAELVLSRLQQEKDRRWQQFIRELNWRLFDSAVPLATQLAIEEIKSKAVELQVWNLDESSGISESVKESLQQRLHEDLFLWRRDQQTLLTELDSVVRMPGWGNIWTQPIINRIDMLATGVNTMLGVRVFGDDTSKIAAKCDEIAAALRNLRGAVDVSADQVVGEGYLEIEIDRQRASRYGVNIGDIQDTIETALGGRVITMTVEGRERFPVRIRYARAFREDEQSVGNLLISSSTGNMPPDSGRSTLSTSATLNADFSASMDQVGSPRTAPVPLQIPLSQVADIRLVQGPSMIRSENGLLRSYVRLNVRDRDLVGFVEEAQQAVASRVSMPPGMYVEWTGQFEHELRARRTLSVIVPVVVLTILVLLFVVYHDLADTLIVMCLTVPGAIFGGLLFQYLFDFNFSVAVWVGYIACFGLATEGGLVMLVYLREAIERRGGLQSLTLDQVREAVMDGAVQRTRPKLMTELTTMIGLAPMLWASGTGSEIMQPMAAPVLGGILVADEVVDLLLPALFYRVRAYRWHRLQRLGAGSDSLSA
jgi:Cu(I)/Ag(I) efflux system membrane protein CusA/SilA